MQIPPDSGGCISWRFMLSLSLIHIFQPPTDKGKRLKLYYMTQVSSNPPTFVCFCNNSELFHFSYQRYLENQIRQTFGLDCTPIRFIVREKNDKKL